jgi:hypothetical protein
VSDYTASLEDRHADLLRVVGHMTRTAIVAECADSSEEELRSLCACIAALGLKAQEGAASGLFF